MSGDLRVENVLIQVRSKLQENGIKLWLSPYYEEGIGSVDDKIEVIFHSFRLNFVMNFVYFVLKKIEQFDKCFQFIT